MSREKIKFEIEAPLNVGPNRVSHSDVKQADGTIVGGVTVVLWCHDGIQQSEIGPLIDAQVALLRDFANQLEENYRATLPQDPGALH